MAILRFKKLQIVGFTDDSGIYRRVVVLPVTKKDIKRGINAEFPGLYGFRGLWYSGNGTKIKSYGKIYELDPDYYKDMMIVRDNIIGLSKKELQKLVD